MVNERWDRIVKLIEDATKHQDQGMKDLLMEKAHDIYRGSPGLLTALLIGLVVLSFVYGLWIGYLGFSP